jgi:glycosyltransferase involved in cell wall biosynthesis
MTRNNRVEKELLLVKPLLSICVPTYNRSSLLRVMLQAALPQVKECGDRVELWISDNASPDDTQEVVEASRPLGPSQYSRNHRNLGFIGNILKLTTELAQGEYVWLVGDDDLLFPGAVARVISTLEANRNLDIVAANFRLASGPDHWPADATGGYDGPCYRLFTTIEEGPVQSWKQLLDPESDLCTAMFAEIVRRQLWVNYWRRRNRSFNGNKLSLTTVFPHSIMFADTVMNSPSYYIQAPLLTVFSGVQSYEDKMGRIWTIYYPRLLHYYQQRGLSGSQLERCVEGVYRKYHYHLPPLLQDKRYWPIAITLSYLAVGWRYRIAWVLLHRAIRQTNRPWFVSKFIGLIAKIKRVVAFGFSRP